MFVPSFLKMRAKTYGGPYIYKIRIFENASTFAPEQLDFVSEQLRFFDIICTPGIQLEEGIQESP